MKVEGKGRGEGGPAELDSSVNCSRVREYFLGDFASDELEYEMGI